MSKTIAKALSRRSFLRSTALLGAVTVVGTSSVHSLMALSDTIYILATGQSNTYGDGDGGSWDISPLVKVWNNANNLFTLDDLGTAWVTPTYGQKPFRRSNNQSVQAANYLARVTGKEVRLIVTAYDGQSINRWHNGSVAGEMYLRTEAILAAAGVSSIDWFLWNQGSADENSPNTYATRWNALITRLTTDGFITASTPLVTSETAHAPLINGVLQAIADADPRCEMAKIGEFPTREGVHFTGPALVRAGWESVHALANTETIFADVAPVQNLSDFVSARPIGGLTFPNHVKTHIPLSAEYGGLSLINDDGEFVSPVAGRYRFFLSGYAGGGATKVMLERPGGHLITVAHSGNAGAEGSSAFVSGEIVLDLQPGDTIRMYVSQGSGEAQTIHPDDTAMFNRFDATYLGPALV